MSGSKTPTIIAITALAVAVLFATPLGQAAGNLVLAKNSVGAAQLKKNAVNSLKVKNGTLVAADFKAGQLQQVRRGRRATLAHRARRATLGRKVLRESRVCPGQRAPTASSPSMERLRGRKT